MKQLIVLVGLPGSGKSTICAPLERQGYVRISQDDQGKEGHKELFKQNLELGKDMIIDRCNFDKKQRGRYLEPAKQAGYKTSIIWLQVGPEECIKRINGRESHPNLAKGNTKISEVVYMFDKMFVTPTLDEADEVIVL